MRQDFGTFSEEVPVHWSEEQRHAIIAESIRILDSPVFKTSKRCVDLLRHLFESALAGNTDGIKERTLGIEVFQREPDYDTASDAIVRQTAGEIRRRLAQCYQEPERSYPVKVHLVQGRYLLGFSFGNQLHIDDSAKTEMSQTSPHMLEQHVPGFAGSENEGKRGPRFDVRNWIIWLVGVLACASVAWLVRSHLSSASDAELWKPMIESGGQVIVCVPDSGPNGLAVPPDRSLDVPYTDADVANMIANKVAGLGGKTILRLSSQISLDDLRRTPSVLIGSFNNRWSMTLLSKLRYTVKTDAATNDRWIEDAQAPSRRDWIVHGKEHFGDDFPAYAVVSRIKSTETRQWIMTVVGLNGYGTIAAGELISSPEFVKFLPLTARGDKNLQIIVQTNVINGTAGPPRILASYSW